MKLTPTLNVSRTTLHLLLAGLAATAVACSAEEKKEASWSCQSADVPMGEVVRCAQSAVTMDGPAPTTDDPLAVPIDVPLDSYECNAGEAGCPPVFNVPGGDSEPCTGVNDNPEKCPPSGGGGTSDGTSDGTSTTGNGNGNGNGPKDGSSGGTTSSGGNNGNGNGNGKGGTSDGTTGTSGGGGKGTHYKCTKDDKGNRNCESTTPVCAPGTHPSPCGACVTDGEANDCVPPSEGGCWVTGGGFITAANITTGAAADGHDNFGGNAKPMKDGRIQGHWNHVDHGTGNHAKGRPEYIVCRHVDEPGPGGPGAKKGFTMNQVYFGGHAEWRNNDVWETGYWFDVVAKDHGEPGSVPHAKNGYMVDTYHFTIRKMDDAAAQVSGAIVYETKGDLQGGNIQMHPPNNGHPYTPMSLPSWVAFEP